MENRQDTEATSYSLRYVIPRNPVWRFIWDSLRVLSLSGQVMEVENPINLRSAHANKLLTQTAKISANVQVKTLLCGFISAFLSFCFLFFVFWLFVILFFALLMFNIVWHTGNTEHIHRQRHGYYSLIACFGDCRRYCSYVVFSNYESTEG